MTPTEAMEHLERHGWRIQRLRAPQATPENILQKFREASPAFVQAWMSLEKCTNAEETAWLLCAPDYLGSGDSAFKWNEFELMSLSSLAGDAEEEDRVMEFWQNHLPFLLSVKTGYSFFAIVVEGANKGSVVHGFEPLFEEASVIAPSVAEFLGMLVAAVANREQEGLLNAAV